MHSHSFSYPNLYVPLADKCILPLASVAGSNAIAATKVFVLSTY